MAGIKTPLRVNQEHQIMPMTFDEFIEREADTRYTAEDIPALLRNHVWDENSDDWLAEARENYPDEFKDDPPVTETYCVPISWTEETVVTGSITVEASSIEDAISKAWEGDGERHTSKEYVEGTTDGPDYRSDGIGIEVVSGNTCTVVCSDVLAAALWKQLDQEADDAANG